jgi:hypothetical protein
VKSFARQIPIAAIVGFSALLALAAPDETVPPLSHYPAHAEAKAVTLGAELLTPDKVRHAFSSDLQRCCLVVELAVYPQDTQTLAVLLDSFTLRVVGTTTAVKASSPKLTAEALHRDADAERDISVTPVGGVGYEVARGPDPATGRQVTQRAAITDLGVGVGVGGRGSAPAATSADAGVMELELSDKGLPEGSTAVPVSGYLYFPLSSRKKKDAYQIEFVFNGEKIVLPLSH